MASWPTGPRDSLLDFTVPIDYMPIYAYVRADDTRFDGDLSKINDSNVTIATLGNKVGVVIAEEDDPLARQYEVTQDTDNIHMLLAVTTKKADVAFAAAFMGADFMKNNLGSLKQVANVGPVRVFGESFAVAKGETKLRDMMNVALVQLQNSGFTRAVLDKYYTEHKGLYFYPAKPWEP
jgi:ABC-type amino acid transport substrate-binding protein